jgi:predicted metallopeptidase
MEPQLFPETIFEQAYVEAPELAALAEVVARKYDEFAEVRAVLAQGLLSVHYVWDTKPFDQNKEDYKPHTIAKVVKAPKLWECISGYQVVMVFRRWFWERFSPEQREAVVFHELSHVGITDGLTVELRHHDLEEFNAVVRHFGPIIPGRKAFVAALVEWQREQTEQLPPDPDPSTVDAETGEIRGEAVVEAMLEAAADPESTIAAPLRNLARKMGSDITVTAHGRSVTLPGGLRCPRCERPVRPGEVHETAADCEDAL